MEKAMTEQTVPWEARALFGARDNVTGAPVFVREGVKGFWNAEGFDIDDFNQRHGWSAEVVESAQMASVFGWHVPLAKPAIDAIERKLKREAVTTE